MFLSSHVYVDDRCIFRDDKMSNLKTIPQDKDTLIQQHNPYNNKGTFLQLQLYKREFDIFLITQITYILSVTVSIFQFTMKCADYAIVLIQLCLGTLAKANIILTSLRRQSVEIEDDRFSHGITMV